MIQTHINTAMANLDNAIVILGGFRGNETAEKVKRELEETSLGLDQISCQMAKNELK